MPPYMTCKKTTIEERAMAHRFGLGQIVQLSHTRLRGVPASGTYEVVRLLPPDGPSMQYRIKAVGETFERLVQEHEIVSASPAAITESRSVPELAG